MPRGGRLLRPARRGGLELVRLEVQPRHVRPAGAVLLPHDRHHRDVPLHALARVVALIKQVVPAVGVVEDAGVARFAGVPGSRLARPQDRPAVVHPPKVNRVVADRHADLLRAVVERARVEQVVVAAVFDKRRRLDALLLPRQIQAHRVGGGRHGRGQRRLVHADLLPRGRIGVGVGRERRLADADHLRRAGRVAGGPVAVKRVADDVGLGVDGAAVGPVAGGNDQVLHLRLREVQAVGGLGVDDVVVAPAAVALEEHADLAVDDAGAGGGAADFAGGHLQRQRALAGPVEQVVAGRGGDAEAAVGLLLGVVHEVGVADADDRRVLRVSAAGIAEVNARRLHRGRRGRREAAEEAKGGEQHRGLGKNVFHGHTGGTEQWTRKPRRARQGAAGREEESLQRQPPSGAGGAGRGRRGRANRARPAPGRARRR